MSDGFAKKAFDDAIAASEDREYNAFKERISDQIGNIATACGMAIGIPEMERLSGAVLKAGVQETFADWTRMVMTIAFAEGYKAKAEEVD